MLNYLPPQPQSYHCAKCADLRARLTALQDENKKLREQLTMAHGNTNWIDEYPNE